MPPRKTDPAADVAEREVQASDPKAQRVGEFVGLGVEHLATVDGEWAVDPATGCITAVL